jgi:hypothetical protein
VLFSFRLYLIFDDLQLPAFDHALDGFGKVKRQNSAGGSLCCAQAGECFAWDFLDVDFWGRSRHCSTCLSDGV